MALAWGQAGRIRAGPMLHDWSNAYDLQAHGGRHVQRSPHAHGVRGSDFGA